MKFGIQHRLVIYSSLAVALGASSFAWAENFGHIDMVRIQEVWGPLMSDKEFQIKGPARTTYPEFDKRLLYYRNRMRVFTDGHGHIFAIARSSNLDLRPSLSNSAFWGKETVLWQLASGFFDPHDPDRFDFDFFDPRVKSNKNDRRAYIESEGNSLTINCDGHSIQLSELKRQAALKIVQNARLVPLPKYRTVELFGRIKSSDDFIYIDRGAFANDIRMFFGKAGQLQEQHPAAMFEINDIGNSISYSGPDFTVHAGGHIVSMETRDRNGAPAVKDIPAPHADAHMLFSDKRPPKEIELIAAVGKELEHVIGSRLFSELKGKALTTPCDLWISGNK